VFDFNELIHVFDFNELIHVFDFNELIYVCLTLKNCQNYNR